MTQLTNLVQFPGLGLSFHLNRVAFSIGGVHIYWYGVCIAVGLCLALVFAFRHSIESVSYTHLTLPTKRIV